MKNKTINQNKKKIHFLPLSACTAYLLVCTLLLTGVTVSKYTILSNDDDSAKAAGSEITVSGSDWSGEIVYGKGEKNDFQYDFSVKGETEVAMEYDVIVDLGGELPEGMEMTLDATRDGISEAEYDDNEGKYVFENAGIFEAGETEEIKHTLKLEAIPERMNNESHIFENISISLLAQQVD